MKKLSYILTAAIFAIGMIGCGADSGENGGNAPSIPTSTIENSQPDVSYFQNAPKASSQTAPSNNFNSARATVLSFSGLAGIGQIYFPFFQQAQGAEASFNNGVWEWEYSFSFGGEGVSFRLTAEEVAGGFNWEMYYTINSSEVSFDNYNVISGFVNTDETMGEWTFNALTEPGTEIPLIKSIWEAINDSERDIDITVFDDQGQSEDTITYTQNGDIHTMVISSNTTVYWDVTNNQGYITDGQGGKLCWSGSGSNGQDVDCASIGL